MWEPRLDNGARPFSASENAQARNKTVANSAVALKHECDGENPRLPAELLILNRFGIGYPFLKTAHRLSQTYNIEAREILFKSGIISEEIWLESQCLLDREREKVRNRHLDEFQKLDLAINNLHRTLPHYSAHRTFTGWQTAAIIALTAAAVSAIYYGDNLGLSVAIFIISTFYTGVIILRALMLARYDKRVETREALPALLSGSLPWYSAVVPLFQEANQIRPLTQHLALLNWPNNRLDIKLICEEDDRETIDAIQALNLPKQFHLIIVPNAQPKTKPKALNHALSECKGEYLVIYDAEDRPSPNQLREAYGRFQSEDGTLACLQAPLIISNSDQNWLTKLFFIEYLTLFRGILPVLASWNMPLPLGGTSNHFKLSILKSVGAWDPYNVTEDADLGIRLVREGYRTSTLDLPTYEEAPPHLIPWIKQRTRWMKGWMQTILVHNRNPIHLFVDLGVRNALIFHLLLSSIVVSSLFHPVFIGLTLVELTNPKSFLENQWLLAFGIYNLVAGYTTYALFAALVLKSHHYPSRWPIIFTIPVYWLLISIAGWRALVHLIVKPHRWEKTPHGLAPNDN